MFKYIKVTILMTLILVGVTSCAPKPPYEVKSPCAAIETDNPWAVNHCVRRSVNAELALA